MALLTGIRIREEVKNGNIEIDPYDDSRINPNSYNLRIGDSLLTYDTTSIEDMDFGLANRYRHITKAGKHVDYNREIILDSHAKNPTKKWIIPEDGFLLQPGILYLGSTLERTYTDKYVPILNGRSSTGRLGMTVHVTAGFGDIGFDGLWTLEITVTHNLIIYPHDEILQVAFMTTEGDRSYQYNGRYNHQDAVTASKFHEQKQGIFQPTSEII